ncbi:MAG: hypothetical protein ACI865_001735 [Flavobacteriaceae bacterium]|jgi:hypothetical protein
MKPTEALLAARIADIIGKPVDDVIPSYKANKEKGWERLQKIWESNQALRNSTHLKEKKENRTMVVVMGMETVKAKEKRRDRSVLLSPYSRWLS